ncbi:MAG: hypothetical protein JRJ39_05795 [Deltaproteobacteria bacterium]|nr:hypothetical protein [Deltaproteobacteria bacterium]MBW1813186.1 hypothetical protein [Deltaproteobacteria bacterium]MBW1848407.1 hypothetical protein [Deltaproteobacteria bacterium]MBW2179248.1 hypothetical protein [Deltaproteobacteria bacterium]
MNFTKDQHLNDDQIICAIVEASDLPDTVRKHLAGCPQCRMAVEQFEEELSTLGKLAHHFSPKPETQITLPVEKTTQSIFSAWKWQFSFGAAFSAVLVFVMVWWAGTTNTAINGGPNNLSGELFEDEELMTEISSLSENALPKFYLDITGEPDPETEDDFMEFVNPSNEDTTLSLKNNRRKGVKLC